MLFNETVVDREDGTDLEKQQQNRLKRIKSLEEHKSRVEKEIAELGDKFSIKRTKIRDDSRLFEMKLNECIANSRKELEVLRAAQRGRLEIKKILDSIIDSVAESV